jgi:small basic protein
MILGLLGGIILGFTLNISYPTEYSFYITMGLLAAIDSILGAARSHLEGKYNNLIFITGFVTNAILAGLVRRNSCFRRQVVPESCRDPEACNRQIHHKKR